jgi:antitoxin component HigA of HigAB toxin-antitoxin module
MKNEVLKKINEYSELCDWQGLDNIAQQHLKSPIGDEGFEELISAYSYVYGQMWMDYAGKKYWGNKLEHLNSMIDCLSWPRKLTDDTYYDLEYIKNVSNKAKLVSEPDKKKELFELALYAIDELLENEPDNNEYKSVKLEVLIDCYEQKVNIVKALESAVDLLQKMLQDINTSNYSTVCSSMMYSRRLKNYYEIPMLVKVNEEFDKHSQTIWSSDTKTMIDWCKHYYYTISSQMSLTHFNNWFSVAKTIPEKLNGTEKDLSNLSYDIYSISNHFENKGLISEAEKTYLLSLEIEQMIYEIDENKKMAWRKLNIARTLIEFYVSHNRLDEAVQQTREQLKYGNKLISNGFEDSELHSQMRNILIRLMQLLDSERTVENYQRVLMHCNRRIELLKEIFNEHINIGDKKIWNYLFYLYEEDYKEQIRYNLFLNRKNEAIEVLNTWYEYLSQYDDIYPDNQGNFRAIRVLKDDKDFEAVWDFADALLSKL